MQRNGNRIHLGTVIIALVFAFLLPFCGVYLNKVNAEVEVGKTRVHFIDVGQGDSAFIELADGKTMLIDAGTKDAGKKVVKYIKNLGYKKIDYLVASHSDDDHIGGFEKVFKEFEIAVIYRPFTISVNSSIKDFQDELYFKFASNLNNYPTEASDEYAKFLFNAYNETYEGNLSEIRIATNMEQIFSTSAENSYVIKFYWPEAVEWFSTTRIKSAYTTLQKTDNNDTSAVVELITRDSKFLFTGDLTTKGEAMLLNSLTSAELINIANVSVLKVGHHGSITSTSSEFLNVVNPTFAVISVGLGNDYGLPDANTLEGLTKQGSVIYRTDNLGTIIVEEVEGFLYFSTIPSKTIMQKYKWLFYVAIFLVIAFCFVCSLIIPKYNKRKKQGIKELEKSLKPVDKTKN